MNKEQVERLAQTYESCHTKERVKFSQLRQVLPGPMLQIIQEIGRKIAPINILETITPTNHATERQKWLERAQQGEFTCPQFQYNQELLKKLAELEGPIACAKTRCRQWIQHTSSGVVANTVMQIVDRRVREAANAVKIAQGILEQDDARTAQAMAEIYGLPQPDTLALAYAYTLEMMNGVDTIRQSPLITQQEIRRLKELHYDAKQVVEIFAWAAERCGFSKTRPIMVDEQVIVTSVRDRSTRGPMVLIPKTASYTGMRILGLVAHEVLCHWRDSENIDIFSKNLQSADERFYEGHAMYEQSQVELLFQGETKRLALPWRVIGIDLAKNGANFAKTAREVLDFVLETEQDARTALDKTWKTCMRIFRGATNTAENKVGYAFPKDRAYFEGEALVNKLCLQGVGDLTEFAALTVDDVEQLAQVVDLDTAGLPYQLPERIICELYEKIMGGDFTA